MTVTKIFDLKITGLPMFAEAVKSAGELKSELDKLSASNRTLNKEAQSLSGDGLKKNREDYAKNEAAIKSLRTAYTQKLNVLRSTAGSYNALAAQTAELTAKYKAFRIGIDGTKADFNKLARQISDNTEKLKSMDAAISHHSRNVGNYSSVWGAAGAKIGGTIKQLALTAGLAFGVNELMNFTKEATKLAFQAEGIERAFDRLNKPELLAELREATKGTVNDMELMKRAVQANNFQIPINQLGDLLKFASQRARDTGESVDFLVESMVTGLARKSPLILDNLGINIKRIQDEMKKTGDFTVAATNVVNEELAKQGPQLLTNADKVEQVGAKWENLKVRFGQLTSTLIGSVSPALNSALEEVDAFFGRVDLHLNGVRSIDTYNDDFQAWKSEYEFWVKRADEKLGKPTTYEQKIKHLNDVLSQGQQKLEAARKSGDSYSFDRALAQVDSAREMIKQLDGQRDQLDKLAKKSGINTLEDIEELQKIYNEMLNKAVGGSAKFKDIQAELKKLDDLKAKWMGEAREKSKDEFDYEAELRKLQEKNIADSFDRQKQHLINDNESYIQSLDAKLKKGQIKQAQYDELKKQAATNLNSDIAAIDAKAAEEKLAREDAISDKAVADARKSNIEASKNAATSYIAELQLLQSRELSYENFLKEKEKLDRKYAKISLENSIKAVEDEIAELESQLNRPTASAGDGKGILPISKEQAEELRVKLAEAQKELAKLKGDLANPDKTGDGENTGASAKLDAFWTKHSQTISAVQDLYGGFFNYIETGMDNELLALDKKKEKELANANITAAQRKAIDEKYAKDREALETRKRKLEQKQAITNATIAGLVEVTKSLSNPPLAVIIGLAAAANVASIASKKFAKGGLLSGPSHTQGGIGLFGNSGSFFGEAEGGEAIINKRSTAMFLPQLSAINVAGGGAPLAPAPYMASGGITRNTYNVSPPVVMPTLEFDYAKLAGMINDIKVAIPIQGTQQGLTDNWNAKNLGRI